MAARAERRGAVDNRFESLEERVAVVERQQGNLKRRVDQLYKGCYLIIQGSNKVEALYKEKVEVPGEARQPKLWRELKAELPEIFTKELAEHWGETWKVPTTAEGTPATAPEPASGVAAPVPTPAPAATPGGGTSAEMDLDATAPRTVPKVNYGPILNGFYENLKESLVNVQIQTKKNPATAEPARILGTFRLQLENGHEQGLIKSLLRKMEPQTRRASGMAVGGKEPDPLPQGQVHTKLLIWVEKTPEERAKGKAKGKGKSDQDSAQAAAAGSDSREGAEAGTDGSGAVPRRGRSGRGTENGGRQRRAAGRGGRSR